MSFPVPMTRLSPRLAGPCRYRACGCSAHSSLFNFGRLAPSLKRPGCQKTFFPHSYFSLRRVAS